MPRQVRAERRACKCGYRERVWKRGADMVAWLQQVHELHMEQSRLESWPDDSGNAFAATLHSLAILDWHVGLNWRRAGGPTLVVRRGGQRVGSWLLNGRTAGLADAQLEAAIEIVSAVTSGSGKLLVGRFHHPHLELSGVNPRWSQSTTEMNVSLGELPSRSTRPLPSWWW
jgi:hypothetical protein